MATFRFPAQHFRAIPAPSGSSSSRVGLFFTTAASVSPDLLEWRAVNPREINRRSGVYSAISQTLKDEPQRFHERNRGITLVANDVSYDDKRKEVVVQLADSELHGVVDGAHTLDAIIQAQQQPNGTSAHVFIKAISDVEPEQIAEIAGGLNTSQQVDLKSLENLRDHFDELKRVLEKQPYSDQIGYKMNENKPVDVREVLYYLAVFDCSEYDDKKHPVALFGRKEGIVRRFADQAKQRAESRKSGSRVQDDSFFMLISKAPEILQLRDLIEKYALEGPVGRFKAGKGTRVRSASNKQNQLIFLNEKVDGKIPLGWMMPMLAGFRANVLWNKPKGSFSWIVPVEELVTRCVGQLILGIQDVHAQENARPEFVGRNSTAWRTSYNAVSLEILRWQLEKERHPRR